MARSLLHTFLGGGVGTAKTVAFELTANESLEKGDIVAAFTSGDNGVLRKAQSTTNQVLGIVSSSNAISAGDECKIVQSGLTVCRTDNVLQSSDIGKPLYLSTSAGIASLTAPSTSGHSVIRIGYVIAVNGTRYPRIVLGLQYIVHLG